MKKILCYLLTVIMLLSISTSLFSCSNQEKEIKEIEAIISDYKNDLGVLRRERKEWQAEYEKTNDKEAKEKVESIDREIRINEAQLSR